DPPKLAPTRRHRSAGMRAYAKLNENAARLVKDDGILVSCSCSAALSMRDLLHVVGGAASRSHRRSEVFHLAYASSDHPVPAAFHEGRYLKAVFARLVP
ncbi:MAG: class I SAM-dependent rRNA methyltransferase, partial [Myxococcota bacterium]